MRCQRRGWGMQSDSELCDRYQRHEQGLYCICKKKTVSLLHILLIPYKEKEMICRKPWDVCSRSGPIQDGCTESH